MERYQVPARRAAYTILGNHDDVEDALQDAWLLATRKLDTLREPERFGGWFYRIVSNVALRKRQQRAAQPTALVLLETLVCAAEELPEFNPQLMRLPVAMQALSARDQIVISLHYFSGAPIATIARLLSIPLGTVKSRLYHARQVLRKELNQMSKQNLTRPNHIPADFRQTIMGMQGVHIPWQPLFTGDFSGWFANQAPIPAGTTPEHWEIVGTDGVVGEDNTDGIKLTCGEIAWGDLELSLLVTPLAGGNVQVLFRVNEQHGWYLVDMLLGWQTVAVSRLTFEPEGNAEMVKLSVVNYPLEHGREYALSIATRGHSITTYLDGALVNQLTDAAWLGGQVGLNVWHGKTLFRDMQIRLLH